MSPTARIARTSTPRARSPNTAPAGMSGRNSHVAHSPTAALSIPNTSDVRVSPNFGTSSSPRYATVGANPDYVRSTHEHLAAMGVVDPNLARLVAALQDAS